MAFISLYCDNNIHGAISTGKIPENTRLRLVFSLGIYPVDIMSYFCHSTETLKQFSIY